MTGTAVDETSRARSTAPRSTHVVVTGAAGWLGQNLVRALLPGERRVRCLTQSNAEATALRVLGEQIEPVVGDIRDPAVLDALFSGTAGASVFHTAAVIHPAKGTREFFDVNVGGTALVLDRAKRSGARRMVHVSSNSPFGFNRAPTERFTEASPPNPYRGYGESKLEAETLVFAAHEEGDVASVVLRAPWFYGPYQPARQTQWFGAVRRGRFPILGRGDQQRSMVYTAHLVDAVLLADTSDAALGRAFWIADAEPYRLQTILETVREALALEGLDVTGRLPHVPAVLGTVAEQVDAFLQSRGRYSQAMHVLGELGHTIACDITEARKVLGYEPTVSLLDGMRASIRWCLDRGDAI